MNAELKKERAIDLIVSIFHYGKFKAETPNEKELETILRELRLWPTSESEIKKRSEWYESQPLTEGEGECCGEWTGGDDYDCNRNGARTKYGTCKCSCHKPQQESKEQRGYCGNCNKEVVYSRFHFDGFCVDRVFTIQDQPQQEGGGETKTSKEDKDTISFNSESNNGEEKPVEKNCIFCQYHLTHMKHFELKQSKKKAIIGMDKRIEEPSKKEECLCQYISDEVESMCCKKKESSPAQVLIA